MFNTPAFDAFYSEATKVTPRWDSLGMLEGIKDKATRHVTSVLLENQDLYNKQNLPVVNENATDTSDIAQFRRISIPLVRRIFPNLIANKIVSVMPLLGPVGLVYYLRFRYSSDKGATRGSTTNAGFPGDDGNTLGQDAAGNVNLDIWYTSQIVNQETQTNAGGGTVLLYNLEHTPVLPNTLMGTVYDGTVAIQTFTADSNNALAFVDIGSPSPKVSSGTFNPTTGVLTFTWSSDPGANSIVVNYEMNMECQQDLPEINMAIENEIVTARTRKLKATWSIEAQQDLRSQHSLEAKEELVNVMAQEINLQIDREVITDLRTQAGTVTNWDYATALGTNIKERFESLFVEITKISNIIHKKTMRGAANFIVLAPEVASIIESATVGFAPAPSEGFTSSAGVQYVGNIHSKWKIYKDPHFPTNQLLVGFKGDSYLDSGYYYCPYVPLEQSPDMYDPDSGCPRKIMMTRYGKKLLNNGARFYGRINILNYIV